MLDGELVSNSLPREVFGKAMTSRMDSLPHSVATNRSRPANVCRRVKISPKKTAKKANKHATKGNAGVRRTAMLQSF